MTWTAAKDARPPAPLRAAHRATPRAPQAEFLKRVRELGPGNDTWRALAEYFACEEEQVRNHWFNKLKEKSQR